MILLAILYNAANLLSLYAAAFVFSIIKIIGS